MSHAVQRRVAKNWKRVSSGHSGERGLASQADRLTCPERFPPSLRPNSERKTAETVGRIDPTHGVAHFLNPHYSSSLTVFLLIPLILPSFVRTPAATNQVARLSHHPPSGVSSCQCQPDDLLQSPTRISSWLTNGHLIRTARTPSFFEELSTCPTTGFSLDRQTQFIPIP